MRNPASSLRAPVLTATVLVVVSSAVVPFMGVQLGASTSFMPALIAAVAVFDIMSAYLLVGEFRDRGELRSLVMASAYVWSLIVMSGYALAFPHAVFADPPLALTPSTAPYLYVAWHFGFPVLLSLAWAPWPARFTQPINPSHRLRLAALVVAVSYMLGAATVATFCLFARELPVLIVGLDTTRMTTITAPIVLPLVTLGLLMTIRGTWHRSGPERWTSVAILTCLCDLVLTYAGRSRFSVGWYAGRTLTIFAAGIVLLAMLASFRRLKAQAERDAVLDPLTGLLNRRGALTTLDIMIAQARRADLPLAALAVDLDWFKAINDQDGHEGGDKVLVEVGRVLSTSSRGGDVAARVGGEEFLVILHNTGQRNAVAAGERLRRLISNLDVSGVRSPISASIGVAVLEGDDLETADLLRRADTALYRAKRNGRNCVEALFTDAETYARS